MKNVLVYVGKSVGKVEEAFFFKFFLQIFIVGVFFIGFHEGKWID